MEQIETTSAVLGLEIIDWLFYFAFCSEEKNAKYLANTLLLSLHLGLLTKFGEGILKFSNTESLKTFLILFWSEDPWTDLWFFIGGIGSKL